MTDELYIGLMSGTSVDGIDAALVDFSNDQTNLIGFHYQPFTAQLKTQIDQISRANQAVLLDDYGKLDSELGQLFAQACLTLLSKSQRSASDVIAIGSHGQTVYHAPSPPYGFSLQIGDPNIIAEITGITTIADFRRRDIAQGGQGAPLVPAFHQAAFGNNQSSRVIINIGGIANITVLSANNTVTGFDTGPGNTLMDYWAQQHLGHNYDANGNWAASGTINTALLNLLKDDPYFSLALPKSTGKEYFSPEWLKNKLNASTSINANDVQATLCKLTADTISSAITQNTPDDRQVLVCGGGVHNQQLLKLLTKNLNIPIHSTSEFGINPDHVEAIAFAWLARQTMHRKTSNLCAVTGAKNTAILGGIYLGNNCNLGKNIAELG